MASTTGAPPAEHAQWRFIEEQEALFTAKTCLIAAQGEQQEDVEYDNESGMSADDTDTDTDDGLMIVDSGLPSLKRKFLDRMAEVFARKKLASFVSAAAMEENEDKVVIYVLRNEPFVEEDEQFRSTLKLCLEAITVEGTFCVVESVFPLTIENRSSV